MVDGRWWLMVVIFFVAAAVDGDVDGDGDWSY